MTIFGEACRWDEEGVPVVALHSGTKKPIEKEWQKSRGTKEQFRKNDVNLGIRTGPHLVDVDLDSPFARAVAGEVLPRTELRWGREGARESHWAYRVPGASTRKFKADAGMLVEIRADGCQSVVPPSVHPSGERYEYDADGPPAEVSYDDLLRCVSFLAAIALWAGLADDLRERRLRHEAALALTGFLLRRGLSAERCERLIALAARAAGDDEEEDRVKAAQTTAEALSAGEKVTGRPRLVEILGEGATSELTTKLVDWLGLDAAGREKSVPKREPNR